MAKRFLAAALGVPLVLAVVFFGGYAPILFDISAAIICVFCVGEFSIASGTIKMYPLSIPALLFAGVYPMVLTYGYGLLTGYLYTGIVLSMLVFCHKKITYKEFAYNYGMTTLITIAVSSIVMMKNTDPAHGSLYFVLSLGLPWMADIGAFFAGSFLGKHKLCPSISPKKTIEGVVGGVLLCIGATCFIGWLFSLLLYQGTVQVRYLPLAILALFGSFLSVIGDLIFSVIKRYFAIKDYGFIIPGHGGFLDRFDSVIMVAPFMLVFITYFPIITT